MHLLSLNRKSRFLLFVGGGFLTLYMLIQAMGPSGPGLDSISYSRIVYDRNGEILRITLTEDEKYRILSDIGSVSPNLVQAVLLKEDRYFYYHPGFNPVSLIKAFYSTYISGNRKIGGSTITMQVARLYYRLHTRTIPGKLRQLFYALYLELNYSKNDILNAYMNLVPCGGNIEGFAAAARIYFDKSIIDITLEEALILSVIPQNPSAFRPKRRKQSESILTARNILLHQWEREYGTDSDSADNLLLPVETGFHIPFKAPHYANFVLEHFPKRTEITGTLDYRLQKQFQLILERYLNRKKELGVNNAALMLVDFEKMEVLVSIGSADFFNASINGQVDGTRARRSPGSTLKPFIYALAMDQGLIHPMTMLKDAPISFSEYAPDNYERDFKGPIFASDALITSRNVPAVALAYHLKSPDLYDFLSLTGKGNLKDKQYYGLSIVLGSAEFSMVELAELYGIIANEGKHQLLSYRLDGGPKKDENPAPLLSPEACYLIRDILSHNPRPGKENWLTRRYRKEPVSYKTGTSIGFKDCWSIGIFNHFIILVWLGNFDGSGNPAFNGRYMATPLMYELYDAVGKDISDENDYNLPLPTLTKVEVCAVSGQLPQDYCRKRKSTYFIPGRSPISKCRICREIFVNKRTGYRSFERSGEDIVRQVVEFWPSDILKLFRDAGIPRRLPPIFDPSGNLDHFATTGIPPTIVSPLKDTEYLIEDGKEQYQQLPLIANVDADVKEVHWFIDKNYIGSSAPDQYQYWEMTPGIFQVSVVDDLGRSVTQELHVKTAYHF